MIFEMIVLVATIIYLFYDCAKLDNKILELSNENLELILDNQKLRDFLERVSQDVDCQGPGCYYCSGHENSHPPTYLAQEARNLLIGDKYA